MSYDFRTIEAQAQQRWATTRAFVVSEDTSRPKYYCLCMLPYPSGAIHMGHVRNYTIGDVISRAKRMAGYNVLQPMGWDAFGLPAENAAIKHGVAPADWTYRNIAQMRAQLQALGFAYDWTRELTTCKPDYYRWEQLLFVRLMAKGLVYRKNSVVNWDPVDQTVLANEQVVDGRGWRSGAPVERKEIAQWFFRITAYAEELLAEIDRLEGWPESVKAMQRNWIGKSEGLEIDFDVIGHDQPLRVYTTRPDTLAGVTYVAVAAEHPLARLAAERDPEVAAFVAECAHIGVAEATIETLEKRGVPTGWQVLHPLSGAALPVYVANFVLMGYGTGAVMAVPGHDARDHAFARKYGLPIRQVIRPLDGREIDIDQAAYTEHGLLINSGAYDGLDYRAAFDAIADDLHAHGKAERKVNYRLRDWGVSRQRYWGCPIPVLYRADGSAVPVPEAELPVVLPEDVAFRGVVSPLVDDPNFTHYVDPVSGERLRRETDTFDTFVQSSWYYARYCCPDATDILDDRARYWLPIDHYIGGIEHATMHLLYFRFWHKLLRDAGLVDSDEPALKLLCQGMVVAETFYRETDGQRIYYNPSEVETESDSRGRLVSARLRSDGEPVTIGAIEKMSKSKNNGVDPQALIERYGADTVRLFSMFAAPPEQSLEWSEAGVDGMARFLRRLWNQIDRHLEAGAPVVVDYRGLILDAEQRRIRRLLHDTLAKVSDDVERRLHFNTAIAAIMELINALAKVERTDATTRMAMQEAWETIVLMLNPITPHICEALWTRLGKASPLVDERWPSVDESARARDLVNVVVQVNGKLRAQLELSPDLDNARVEEAARSDAQVARYLAEGSVRKVIVVANKLINFVVQ